MSEPAAERVLLDLDDDLLHAIARCLMSQDLPAALRLLQTCRQLLASLHAVKTEAAARRLQLQPQLSCRAEIEGDGATLTRAPSALSTQSAAWAAGGLLPTIGTFKWRVHTNLAPTNRRCLIFVGVCDAACTTAWVAAPFQGRLTRLARSDDGMFWSSISADNPPPAGFPCGHMFGYRSFSMKPHRRPQMHVMVDQERGTLSFGVDGLPWATTLGAAGADAPGRLPPQAALRPWVALIDRDDKCQFDPYIHLVG